MRNRITILLTALALALGLSVAVPSAANAASTVYGSWRTCPVGNVVDYQVRPVWSITGSTSRMIELQFRLAPHAHQPLPDKATWVFVYQTKYSPITGTDEHFAATWNRNVKLGVNAPATHAVTRAAYWLVQIATPIGAVCEANVKSA